MNVHETLRRSERLSGRDTSGIPLVLSRQTDAFDMVLLAVAILDAPAGITFAILRRRHRSGSVFAALFAIGVAAAFLLAGPLWIAAGPIGGPLALIASIVTEWPTTWGPLAIAAWVLSAGTVGPVLAYLSQWHRERYRPTRPTTESISDEALDEAELAARCIDLDPAEFVIGPDVDTGELVTIAADELTRHALLIGESGTGKTVLIAQLVNWSLRTGPRVSR